MATMYPITSLLSLTLTFLLLNLTYQVQCHGYMRQPCARNSRWTVLHDGSPADYNHMSLNCGGKYVQYNHNDGNCGPCGDNFGNTRPRAHEAGGTYVPESRTVVATYTQGQVIGVTVTITASHLGYFEFRLCQVNDFSANIEQNCLDENVLKIAGTQNTRYTPPGGGINTHGNYSLNLKLPDNVNCELCVLQWVYNVGNSYGFDDNGRYCLGCGDQEQFINCADIAIIATSSATSPSSSSSSTSMASNAPASERSGVVCLSTPDIRATISKCTVTTTYAGVSGMVGWCINNCRVGNCPYTHCEICYCTAPSTTPSTTASNEQSSAVCLSTPGLRATISRCTVTTTYADVPGMERWCINNCKADFCPASHCEICYCTASSTTASNERSGAVCSSTPGIQATISRCTVTAMYANVPGMERWCINNCRANYCPASHCELCYCHL